MADAASVKSDANPSDILRHTGQMVWIPFSDGISVKVLRTSPETGVWTVMFKCAKDSSFAPHLHHGAGEYLILKGAMDYRAGIARTGDYGYEPLGVYHEKTTFPEETELWFSNHGPIAFLNPDRSIKMLVDWKFFADIQK